jgi:hypothetical protein
MILHKLVILFSIKLSSFRYYSFFTKHQKFSANTYKIKRNLTYNVNSY